MQKICKKLGIFGILLFLMLVAAGVGGTTRVEAATAGFKTVNGKTYYYNSNGKKHTGWLTLNGKKYYFYKDTGVMATGWVKNSAGKMRYFYKGSGIMATGWVTNGSKKLYFYKNTGYMATGWVANSNGKKRYFNPTTGVMQTGWMTDSDGVKRYFYSNTGYMATGWVKNSSGKRYFYNGTGAMATGWVKTSTGQYRYFASGSGYMVTGWIANSSGQKRYFDPSTGIMCTETTTIDGKICTFDSNGILLSQTTPVTMTAPTAERTIKNYLAGAIQPVGQALYVWGGGWNDSTLIGVSSTWKQFYDSQSSSYDYNNYRDLSASTRAKGLDCSGFVGWAAYQVMQTKSGVGSGYTVVSGDIGSYYVSLGWGSIVTQSALSSSSWTLKPGDVGYNSGHTWIVIGQCSDKSVVIVHSTPNAGCQIAGTPTPSGDYSSEAAALAKKYMSKFSGYYKYNYNTTTGNYIRNGNYLRWNSATLSDPDGYSSMTADEILADLFS
jgi:glucan-binding YG repeat protein